MKRQKLSLRIILGLIMLCLNIACTQPVLRKENDPANPAKSHFTQTRITTKGQNRQSAEFTCSFIEFDQHGDFLMEGLHTDAQRKGTPKARYATQLENALTQVRNLARGSKPPLLVFYCHGWHNSAQSNDVIRFQEFLRHLAELGRVNQQHQVHGVYLAWKANPLPLKADQKGSDFADYIKPQVDPVTGTLNLVPAFFTYWRAKDTAENRVSGAALTGTVFRLAYEAKKNNGARVCVMGHSFGALALERAVLHGYIGLLAARETGGQNITLPFDLMLFINSAAHSTEAKQQIDFLDSIMSKEVKKPLVISLQSSNDIGTGLAHKIGNVGTWFVRQSWRKYAGYNKNPRDKVFQGYFRARTPGNNGYLITHRVFSADEIAQMENDQVIPKGQVQMPDALPADRSNHECVMLKNMLDGTTAHLHTSSKNPDQPKKADRWTTVHYTAEAQHFTSLSGRNTSKNAVTPKLTPYWIISVPDAIINGHTDIWNNQAVELYVKCFAWSQAGSEVTTKRAGVKADPAIQSHLKDNHIIAPMRAGGLF